MGKPLRGRSRADEHAAVLAEIASVADERAVDLVLVVGDLFDSAAPPPEAERIVYEALLRLSSGPDGVRPVVVVAGNHDNAARLSAVAPVFAARGVTILDKPTSPSDGGVVEIDTPGGRARLALLPFPSHRGVVTAAQLMGQEAADHGQTYADRVRTILAKLSDGFTADAVNIVCAHLMVMGGTMGGGERGAHTIFDYWVPATAFPVTAHYAALGHLHRPQQLDGPCPLHYCGSPLQLDFGETANAPQVNVVSAEPGKAGVQVEAVLLSAGRRLRVIRGTPEELGGLVGTTGDDHLKLVVDSPPVPGLADGLREAFPTAVEVVLAAQELEERRGGEVESRAGRSPQELFASYLTEVGASEPAVQALFAELVDDLVESS